MDRERGKGRDPVRILEEKSDYPPTFDRRVFQMATPLHHLRGDVASADVTLLCQGRRFPAHRLILSAGSLYLRSIFNGRMKKSKGTTVKVPAPVTPEVLEDILEFLYSGKIPYRNYEKDFLLTAVASCKVLQINDLFAYNLHLLAEYWSTNNVLELFHLVKEYEDSDWPSQLVSHLVNKFCHLHKRRDFLSLGQNELNKLLHYLKADQVPAAEFATAILSRLNFDKTRDIDVVTLTFMSTFARPTSRMSTPILNKNHCTKASKLILADTLQSYKSLPSKDVKSALISPKLICFGREDGYSVVRFYDIEMDSWSPSERLPFDLMYGSAIVEFEQHIYLLGGSPARRTGGSEEVTIFCPASNTSIYKHSLCFPIVGSSAGVLRGLIYVVGGKNWLNHLFPTHRVQCYNPVTGESKEIDGTYNKNWRCEVFVFRDKLYVLDLDEHCLERYDPDVNQWTSFNCKKFKETFSSRSAFINGQFYFTVKRGAPVFRIFHISRNMRSSIVNHRKSVSIHQMWPATRNGQPVLLIQSKSQNFYLYDLNSNTWEEKSSDASLQEDNTDCILVTCRHSSQTQPKPPNLLTPTADFMRRQSICTDVTLSCSGGDDFQAHQLTLSVASPFFQSMFSSEFKESVTGVVNIPTLSGEIMENILEFVYTGKMKQDPMNVQLMMEILAASHLTNIPSVFHFCLAKLVKDHNHGNYLPLVELVNFLYGQAPTMHIITFFVHNFQRISQQVDFLAFDHVVLRRILHHPDMHLLCSIDGVVEAVLKWGDAKADRSGHLKEMLSCINMRYLSPECAARISDHEVIKGNPDTFGSMIDQIQETNDRALFGQVLLSVGWNAASFSHEVGFYGIKNNRWANFSYELPYPLPDNVTVVAFGCLVFFIGGIEIESATVTANVLRYCPFSNKITADSKLQFAVEGAGADVIDDAIYVVGGMNIKGLHLRSVQRYIPALNVCKEVSPCQKSYYKPIVISYKSLLYVLGSTPNTGNVLECYNSLINQWTVVTLIPTLFTYRHCSAVISQDKLFFLSKGCDLDPSMQVYDFSRNVWEALPDVNIRTLKRADRLVVAEKGNKDVIFVFQKDNFLKLYDVTTSKWAQKLSNPNRTYLENEMIVSLRLPNANRN